jgi:hypothetical protein
MGKHASINGAFYAQVHPSNPYRYRNTDRNRKTYPHPMLHPDPKRNSTLNPIGTDHSLVTIECAGMLPCSTAGETIVHITKTWERGQVFAIIPNSTLPFVLLNLHYFPLNRRC